MNKKLQLKVIVFLCMIIVIFVYFYISKGFSFGISKDIQGLRDSVGVNMDELLDSTLINDLQDRFNDVKDQMTEKEEGIKSEITEKVLDKLSHRDNIIYEYEPWGFKFNYDNLMLKEVNEAEEKILLFYEDVSDVNLEIEKYNLRGTFNDWLNNNYDLQNLSKCEYNDLIFWMRDLSDNENKMEEYYVNIEDNIFIISLSSSNEKKEDYWNFLKNIVESFSLINPINL